MPKRKAYPTRRTGGLNRRRYKKRRGIRRKYSMAAGTLIADRTKVALKYHDDLVINVNGVAGSNYLFRCNSIFDPDQSSTGHQPMGHDQYAMFYDRYCVIGAKLTVTFKSRETTDATNDDDGFVNAGVCIIANPTETITANDDFMENNKATYVQLCPQRPVGKVTKKFSAKRFFGVKNVLDDGIIQSGFGANPANEAYWQLRMWNPTSSTSNRFVYANIAIQYICVMKERRRIAGS